MTSSRSVRFSTHRAMTPANRQPLDSRHSLSHASTAIGPSQRAAGEKRSGPKRAVECCGILAPISWIKVSDPSLSLSLSMLIRRPFFAPLLEALVLFGPPEKVTAFASSARGQLPENVDDDFVIHLHYPTTAPLPPDSEAPLPGTRIAGPRVTLGASCLSAHTDAEQPRWKVEGTRGSFLKTGTDPQENQLKAGWTPASHPEAFGIYAKDSPRALSSARLTTSTAASSAATVAAAASAGGAPKQPELASTDIPMLPGRYIDFYANVGDTIWAVEAVRESGGVDEIEKVKKERLLVKIDETVDVTKCILLARKSAAEERTVKWSEGV